jgi:pimeloyl-ACP methyl ester carboxylesterase
MNVSVGRTARRLAAYWIVLAAALAGCQGRQLVLNSEHLDQGLIVVLPGIDGRAPYNEAACTALSSDRPSMAVELHNWTVPLGPLYNQCAYGRNRKAAAELAQRILAYQSSHPGGRVFLVGHSGGTAIAVWAAEALPDGDSVDGIVLLASSLSPSYDLSGALAKSRNGIVSFCSHRDSLLLGLGTAVFGTMDRRHTAAAGQVGFQRPNPLLRLDCVAWRDRLSRGQR